VRIALLASRPRLGHPFHIASTLITMRKLIQYIWFPRSTPGILMYFFAGRTSPQRIRFSWVKRVIGNALANLNAARRLITCAFGYPLAIGFGEVDPP
jgi:hypothetical protein